MMRTKKLLRTDPVETSFLSLPRDPTVKVGSFVSFCSFVLVTNLVLKNRRGSNLTRCGGYWKIFPSSGRIGYWWSIMWHETPFTGMCLIVRPMAAHCDLLMVKRPSCRNIFLFQKCDKNPFLFSDDGHYDRVRGSFAQLLSKWSFTLESFRKDRTRDDIL